MHSIHVVVGLLADVAALVEILVICHAAGELTIVGLAVDEVVAVSRTWSLAGWLGRWKWLLGWRSRRGLLRGCDGAKGKDVSYGSGRGEEASRECMNTYDQLPNKSPYSHHA